MDKTKSFAGINRFRGGINRGLFSKSIQLGEGAGYTSNKLKESFGEPERLPDYFIAMYTNTNDGKKYLVTVSNGEFKGTLFNAVS